ncbi:hypothetical protein DSO57_1021016 [Entomophthora muscae]|uniref:Uncharacterized protein n=1 Tax=Entomophthora muscae TaxID=34485 RepID=A0ACC2S5E9_9FUNG|nr:hypothetical protein DSO57_1021016 [Entomophthora muscae]
MPAGARRVVLWLGSSIGSFDREDAKAFMSKVENSLVPGDCMLLGIDLMNPEKISLAYDDPKGVTRDFIMNGLVHCDRILGGGVIDPKDFSYRSQVDIVNSFHKSSYLCLNPVSIPKYGIEIQQGEEIHIEQSCKYNNNQIHSLLDDTHLVCAAQWLDPFNSYTLNIAHKPPFYFKAPKHAVPQPEEWLELWRSWEYICHLITDELLLVKPISLRHPFVFYLGHIPAFLDIQLANHLKEPFTEPSSFATHFERGIDPDVNDPTKCHSHSEIPAVWPTRKEISEYQERVKQRLISASSLPEDARLGRVLVYAFEHQAMHIETLLYMLLRVTPLTNATALVPIKNQNSERVKKSSLLQVPSGTVRLGIDDKEELDELHSPTTYGWDNESPSREVMVPNFHLDSRPVTNGEFLDFLKATINLNYPASWIPIDLPQFTFQVMSFNGPVSMERAINWPVMVAHDQALAYAEWRGMRLPTEPELNRARDLHAALISQADDLGADANYSNRLFRPRTIAANASLHRWQPIEVVDNGGFQLFGDGWEWTGTPLLPHAGFKASKLYPGYSADFFDHKHMVILGGSYATHPRMSSRPSFRNWYHRGYAYMFATFRCAV